MTRSPLVITLLPLIPLALLAWPLSAVISKKPPRKHRATPTTETQQGPLMTAELSILAAHPYEDVTVKVGDSGVPSDHVTEISRATVDSRGN